jgi:hypothetical protein
MSPEMLTAIAALLALILTIWQGILTRSHDRLSVKPLLSFTLATMNLENHPVGIFLRNDGLGPAVIRKVSVFNGMKVASGKAALREIIIPIATELEIMGQVQHFWVDPGYGLQAGSSIKMLWVYPGAAEMQMIGLMAKINIRLEYESIYGDRMNPIYLHTE